MLLVAFGGCLWRDRRVRVVLSAVDISLLLSFVALWHSAYHRSLRLHTVGFRGRRRCSLLHSVEFRGRRRCCIP
ncbi:hypothetical protein BJ508DRAFT_172874 [Ascobolus immersus RN42]|uniref:Uncharacterized protein n=1 Tax=Ascobolus immersus RN42 TaxID=1160509 RepID=A0A3N4HTV9_ASCIM|nr:hypothetical protein BJ508DRAFT_172874 [Ascobolus immersus RN42]